MKKVIQVLVTIIPFCVNAQSTVVTRLSSGYDLGMAYSASNYNPSIVYYQLINMGRQKVITLGWTARLGAYYANNVDSYTAPARLTRGKSGLNALSAPLIVNNMDTIRYDYLSNTSLNVGFRAQINLGRINIGGSVDLIGLTLGKLRPGQYISSTGQFRLRSTSGSDSTTAYFKGANAFQESKPTRLNARLLGDNDRGTLSTEVYARVSMSQRLAVKVGYQWLTTETTVSNRDIIADNNRFRTRAGLAYLALTFPIFN